VLEGLGRWAQTHLSEFHTDINQGDNPRSD